ncbi:tetratricopeptide (TPR) repeat protein [Gellertiella hungarica]|uniref:Tetratricopeptide (TPR) repeat protein n=2 Tax=Gellertiella hungarica TaxID=1572859 RepID=A0A7W6J3Y7_9HYPH|nr:tetratricopeptide (TPR) repeat protein [Gellertiella hungarica]
MKGHFMRQSLALRFLSSVAMAAMLLAGATPAWSAGDAKQPAPAEESFNADGVSSFAGAFLAARTADVDRDYRNAIPLYRKALELEPDNTEIRERLMIASFLSGDFDGGVKLAEQLRSDVAVERITVIARGLDAIKRGDYAKADSILKYEGPNDLERLMTSLLLAWSRFGAGQKDEALKMVTDLKGPEWFAIFRNYHAGALAAAAGNTEKARALLKTAVIDKDGGSTAPDTYIRAVMALARLEAREGNLQKALDTIATGDQLINNYAPLKALADELKKGGKPEQQVRTAAQGAAAVLFSIGGALNRQGADEAVSLYLNIAHALDPDSADTLVLLGGLAEAANQPERAIEFYRKVPSSSPLRRISELQLGLALASTGKMDDARKHLQALIASDPKDLRSYLAYGSILSDAKDYREMARNYDQAIASLGARREKSHWSLYFQRGIAYERLKEWDKAEPNFKTALELNPDQPQVLNYLGYSWVDMNRNLKEGMDMIRRAVELRPDDGYIVDSLGWAYYRLGQFQDAVEELERAAELKAGDATINDHLGDAYWRVGRTREAVFQWQRALVMKPEEAEIPKINAKIKNGLPPLEPQKKVENTETKAPAPAGQTEAAAPAAPAAPKSEPAATTTAPAPDAPAAPAATAEGAAATATTDYTVANGDSVWKIAARLLGDWKRGEEIIRLNPALQKNPDRLKVGQVLKIPAKTN